jgi:hypothetical protein
MIASATPEVTAVQAEVLDRLLPAAAAVIEIDNAMALAALFPSQRHAQITREPWLRQVEDVVAQAVDWPLGVLELPHHPLASLLMKCCREGKSACVQVLLDAGAPADYVETARDSAPIGYLTLDPSSALQGSPDVKTPLLACANAGGDAVDLTRGQVECAKKLLRRGARLEVETAAYFGGTALDNALATLEVGSAAYVPTPNALDLVETLRAEPRRRATAAALRLLSCAVKFQVLRMRAARRAYAPGGDGFISSWASFNEELRAQRCGLPQKRGRGID